MANRRYLLQILTRQSQSLFFSRAFHQTLTTLPSSSPSLYSFSATQHHHPLPLQNPTSHLYLNLQTPFSIRSFSRFSGKDKGREEEPGEEYDIDEDGSDDDEDDNDEEDGDELSDEEGDPRVSNLNISRTYTVEEIEEEAAAIGYKVMGPLDPTERPFKWREPVFAIVQIGSHQFKVSNGDYIYTERLKFCEVNDKLLLNKVLMLGSQTQTIIGRPILPEAAVYAVVEEHALDAKVIIFKKKRRKNYRRTKGHRQELTRLRITDIQGIEKPEKVEKPEKLNKTQRLAKAEKEAMAA